MNLEACAQLSDKTRGVSLQVLMVALETAKRDFEQKKLFLIKFILSPHSENEKRTFTSKLRNARNQFYVLRYFTSRMSFRKTFQGST